MPVPTQLHPWALVQGDPRGRPVPRGRRRRIALLASLCFAGTALAPTATAAAGTTYYVDCSAGNDTRAGTSAGDAWRSVSRANGASLAPGSALLFKRGCTWSGTSLQAKWNGTATQPITIGAYGSGSAPLFQNAQDQVYVRGSWLIIENLAARADPVTRDPQCGSAPAGRRTGFRLVSGASHDLLRNLVASDLFIGIKLDTGSHHNRVINSVARDNDMKSDVWSSDAGMVGIALLGDDNEVAYNTVSGSDACSRFYGRDGSAFEVYGGQRNRIHHNRAIDNNQFVELGNPRASDNTIAYNVVSSRLASGHFLTTRGTEDAKYGPVLRTKAYDNSVYLTGATSFAVQCGHGCGPSVLSMRNNIIWAADRVGYADAAFDEGNNIFWTPGGNTKVWFPMSSTSRKADPRWVSPGSGDFHLQSSSPAVDAGGNAALQMGYGTDFSGVTVPQGGAVDIGAFEYATAAPPSTVASDAFSRASGSGWGSADLGGSYTHLGPGADFGVQNGAGWLRAAPGQSRGATLYGTSARDIEVRARVTLDSAASSDSFWIYLVTRRSTDGSEYRAKLRVGPDRRLYAGISKTAANKESRLVGETLTGLTAGAGSSLRIRVSVTGAAPTSLRLKVWPAGQTEPSAWTMTATDGTPALQDGGAVGVQAYAGVDGNTVFLRFDDLVVTRL